MASGITNYSICNVSFPPVAEKIYSFDQNLEQSLNNFTRRFRIEFKMFIYTSTVIVFGYSFRKTGLFSGLKNSLFFYSFCSLLLCRENLNPYSKYKH